MDLTPQELVKLKNIAKLLDRGRFDNLNGLEVVAFADAYSFLKELIEKNDTKDGKDGN